MKEFKAAIEKAEIKFLKADLELELCVKDDTTTTYIAYILGMANTIKFLEKLGCSCTTDLIGKRVLVTESNKGLLCKPLNHEVYTVTWKIELGADSPEEAAKEAHKILKDPNTLATYLEVTNSHSEDVLKFDTYSDTQPFW